MRSVAICLGLLLLIPGLLRAAEPQSQQFGGTMPEGTAQSIAAAIDGYRGALTEPQKFSGRVAKVCRQKGCWMELEADGRSARVTMLDYGFFLPGDASGAAEVFGTLSEVEMDEKTAAHYARDAGTDVAAVPLREFRIVAHAITLNAGGG